MDSKKYKLVLFDLDGTLLDTLEDLRAAVNHALGKRCLPLHDREAIRVRVGHGVRNLIKRSLPEDFNADEAYVDSCLADFRSFYTANIDVATVPYPGMPELLAELDREGVRLAVVSNKFQEGTERLIREFFPEVRFAAILGNREGHPLKPDPAIIGEALALAGVAPSEAVMVGDSPTDMLTASNAGIDAIAVTWGYRPAESLAGHRLAGSVPELRQAIPG